MDELYAVGWRSVGRPRRVGVVGVPVAGSGVAHGHAACAGGGRWRVYGPWGGRCRRRHGRGGAGSRRLAEGILAEGIEDASTGLMPEQKLVVPVCPRRENGHLWRFDRERSTGDCQADVCQACGLVRLTSYRTGQVVRYAGSGRRRRMNGEQGRVLQPDSARAPFGRRRI